MCGWVIDVEKLQILSEGHLRIIKKNWPTTNGIIYWYPLFLQTPIIEKYVKIRCKSDIEHWFIVTQSFIDCFDRLSVEDKLILITFVYPKPVIGRLLCKISYCSLFHFKTATTMKALVVVLILGIVVTSEVAGMFVLNIAQYFVKDKRCKSC